MSVLRYQNTTNSRRITDTYTDQATPSDQHGSDLTTICGTHGSEGPYWSWYHIDLCNVDPSALISSALLSVEVTVGAVTGAPLRIVSPMADFDYDLDLLSLDDYDGLHPWPLALVEEYLDESTAVFDTQPTGTGTKIFADLTVLVERALRTESKQLILVIYQSSGITSMFTSHSTEAVVGSNRPSFTLTVSDQTYTKVVRNGYETVDIPKVRSMARPNTHRSYQAKGDIIVANAKHAPSKITFGNDEDFIVADAAQDQGLKWAGQSDILLGLKPWTMLLCGFCCSNTATNLQLQYGPSIRGDSGAARGHVLPYGGSIRAASIMCDVNVWTSGNVQLQWGVNGTAFNTSGPKITLAGIGNGQSAYLTYATGVHTFNAGDIFKVQRSLTDTPVGLTTDDTICAVWLEFDP